MSRFNLILAVSQDGFVARGTCDDMSWTGKKDKFLFKLLTTIGASSVSTPVLLAGRTTYKQMPTLPGRRMVMLSQQDRLGFTLREASRIWPDAWLIGGATVAEEALNLGLVEKAYIFRSQTVLGHGLPFEPISRHLSEPVFKGELEGIAISMHRGRGHGA